MKYIYLILIFYSIEVIANDINKKDLKRAVEASLDFQKRKTPQIKQELINNCKKSLTNDYIKEQLTYINSLIKNAAKAGRNEISLYHNINSSCSKNFQTIPYASTYIDITLNEKDSIDLWSQELQLIFNYYKKKDMGIFVNLNMQASENGSDGFYIQIFWKKNPSKIKRTIFDYGRKLIYKHHLYNDIN